MSGPQAITYQELRAWSEVTGQPLAYHETRLLMEMDQVFLSEAAKARKQTEEKARRGRRNV